MISQINNEGEKTFANSFFDHNNWIYQPKSYYFSDGSKYKPDFKDLKRKAIIEVSNTKQAFHKNKMKYARFLKEFPLIKFEIRDKHGNFLKKYYEICLKLSKQINVDEKDIWLVSF